MNVIIVLIVMVNIHVLATGAAYSTVSKPLSTTILSLLKPFSALHHKKIAFDLLTSKDKNAPNLLPDIAHLCLAYAETQPSFPGSMRYMGRITTPNPSTTAIYKITRTQNNRIIMAAATYNYDPSLTSYRNNIELYEVHPKTYKLTLLTSLSNKFLEFTLTYQTRMVASNDGKYIAFYNGPTHSSIQRDLWLLNLSTGTVTRISTNAHTNIHAATFSSDNLRLAYATNSKNKKTINSLTIMDLATFRPITTMYGKQTHCQGRLMSLINIAPDPMQYTAQFFDIDNTDMKTPLYSVTYSKQRNTCPRIIVGDHRKEFILEEPDTICCRTITETGCTPLCTTNRKSKQCHSKSTITEDRIVFSCDGNCTDYSIKETLSTGFYLCNTTYPNSTLRIPYANNVHYWPNNNILLCERNFAATDRGIHIFEFNPSLSDLLAKLDSETYDHLFNIIRQHNKLSAPLTNSPYTPNAAERTALERFQKISPELYENFIQWCNITAIN